MPALEVGGAERVMLDIAAGLAGRGHGVDLVVCDASGPNRHHLSPSVRLVELGGRRTAAALLGLARYLRRERPRALLATMNHVNVIALAAAELSRSGTLVTVREASNVSGQLRDNPGLRTRVLPALMSLSYRRAHCVIAVSHAASDDLCRHVRVDPRKLRVVYNPIDFATLHAAARERTNHPWLDEPSGPVIVGVGRLSPEKDWGSLLRALAQLEAKDARVVIVGEGGQRGSLTSLARDLGLADRVSLPGYRTNPFSFLRAASVAVLCSRWEGLPSSLIHSVALRTPTIATDAPGGAREILEDGALGALVPVGDVAALASALSAQLARRAPPEPAPSWYARFEASSVVASYARAMGLEGDRS